MLSKITKRNAAAFQALIQEYEEEFSSITGKKKSEDGKYALDSNWKEPYEGYYWMVDEKIGGFCIVACAEGISDIMEFYICPQFRKVKHGTKFAFAIFNAYAGKWQVRQIKGAKVARSFWRSVIKEYTKDHYTEAIMEDPHWGTITCQNFYSI